MKVFLDVGANNGQSLAAAMLPQWGFDRIYCFEPAPACWPYLTKMADGRVKIKRFGLWDRDAEMPLFQPGTKGAGMWKKDRGTIDETEVCRFARAADWMRKHIKPDDSVFLKLNCEGAECDILDDLLDSGEFAKVSYLMVDFDVRKIATLAHREEQMKARLAEFGHPRVSTSKEVMRGETHIDRINNWLSLCH
tara:strand:+ start:234 stop:812 length:579 start_codon:yes stop_codon:yes gene_type:complete